MSCPMSFDEINPLGLFNSPVASSTSADKNELLHIECVKSELNWLAGKILTICDATFSDLVQRKANKDLVKQAFWLAIDNLHKVASGELAVPAQGAVASKSKKSKS